MGLENVKPDKPLSLNGRLIWMPGWLRRDGRLPVWGETPLITAMITDSTRLVSSSALSYQWYRNGVLIEGATDSIYVPSFVGNYKVAIPGNA